MRQIHKNHLEGRNEILNCKRYKVEDPDEIKLATGTFRIKFQSG